MVHGDARVVMSTYGGGHKMMRILLERIDKSPIFALRKVRNEKFAMT